MMSPKSFMIALSIALTLVTTGCVGGIKKEGALTMRAGSIERHSDGTIRLALLVEPADIGAVPATGWTRFFPSGHLESADLARDTSFGTQPIPSGSRVFFDDGGVLVGTYLSCDTRLDGIPCEGGPWKFHTEFHPNGRVRSTFLSGDSQIQGVPCAESSQVPVRFDPEGKLIGCKLSRAATIAGKEFRKGAVIELLADGSVAAR